MKGLLTFFMILIFLPFMLYLGIAVILLNPILAAIVAVCITAIIMAKILKKWGVKLWTN